MRTIYAVMAFVASLSAPLAVEAQELRVEPDHRYGEIADPSVWPVSSVGVVTLWFDFRRYGFCTGTLVGPRFVLTAAHCLFKGKRLAKVGDVRFLAALDKGVPAAYSVATRLVISERYMPGSLTLDNIPNDWAVIVLRDALPLKPVSIKSILPEQLGVLSHSGSFVHVGYGVKRRYVPSIVRGCGVSEDPNHRLFIFRCLTNFGYSGAPLLAEIDGTPSLIGISSVGSPKDRVGLAVPAIQFEMAVAELMQLQY